MPEADWLHRFRNLGKAVYVALRDHSSISIYEVDAAVDSFCVRNIRSEVETEVAASLRYLIADHHLERSVFFVFGESCNPKTVVLVLDPAFGDKLRPVTLRRPAWVVPSAENRAAVEEAWLASRPGGETRAVTIWSAVPPTETEQDWRSIIELIELHHGQLSCDPPVDTLCVYGAELTGPASAALHQAGYQLQRSAPGGFVAVKNETA